MDNENKPVILVAEDVESNYLLVYTILKKEYTLFHAWTGKEAVEMFEKSRPDIILMDMKMPEMDGLEATKKIRETDTEIPIIALTAFAFDQDRQRSEDAGCNDYLSKPIMAQQLKDIITKWLKK